jgi:Flp pilus assembly protein TadG
MLSLRTRNQNDRDDRGVVALEMVLVLPILITLIFGVVVLGNALSVKTQTMGFARDGAREAALGEPFPVKEGVVFAFVSAPCPNPTDTTKFVTVQATMPILARNIPFVPDSAIRDQITEKVTMRCGG